MLLFLNQVLSFFTQTIHFSQYFSQYFFQYYLSRCYYLLFLGTGTYSHNCINQPKYIHHHTRSEKRFSSSPGIKLTGYQTAFHTFKKRQVSEPHWADSIYIV